MNGDAKVAIVTGVGSGIGGPQGFASPRDGYRVAFVDINETSVKATAGQTPAGSITLVTFRGSQAGVLDRR